MGSRKRDLQSVALKVLNLAIQYHIVLEPEWVPRELNEQADYLSRIIDYDDWFLNPVVFAELDAAWGPHTVEPISTIGRHPDSIVGVGTLAQRQ